MRWRATGYGAPIALLWVGDPRLDRRSTSARVNAMSDLVLKQVTFFGSYFLVLCFVASVIRRGRAARPDPQAARGRRRDRRAPRALYEWRTGMNLYNGLGHVLPFLHYQDIGDAHVRGTGARALASAQHPIALGAALVMLLPLAIYLFKRTGQGDLARLPAGVLTLGALSTGSRTAAPDADGGRRAASSWLKRDELMRMLPVLLVLLVVDPGRDAGHARDRSSSCSTPPTWSRSSPSRCGTGSGRIADLGPSLREWAGGNPFVGQGFGTRMTRRRASRAARRSSTTSGSARCSRSARSAPVGLMWLFCRAIRRLARRAREDDGHATAGWRRASAASLLAWTLGLFTYDAFAFIQVTFLAFILLGHRRRRGARRRRRSRAVTTSARAWPATRCEAHRRRIPGGPEPARRPGPGTPSGVMRGLAAAGAEPVAIQAEPSRARARRRAQRGHRRLPAAGPRAQGGRAARPRGRLGVARPSPRSTRGRPPSGCAQAGRLDGIVQIGTGYTLETDVPIATFEDMTIAQTRGPRLRRLERHLAAGVRVPARAPAARSTSRPRPSA